MDRVKQVLSFLGKTDEAKSPFDDVEKRFLAAGLDLSKEPYKVTGADLKKKRDDKLAKYRDKLHTFMKFKLYDRLPSSVDFDSVNAEMDIALLEELNKFYTGDPELFKKWWKQTSGGKEYRDLNIGPIILKSLSYDKTAQPTPADGFMARVKGTAFDTLRKADILSQGDRKKVKEITNFIAKIKDTENRAPSDTEIAKFMSMDKEKVKQYLLLASFHDTSFDASIDSLRGDDYSVKLKDGKGGLNDPENPELLVIKSDMMEKAKTEINKLPEAERNVIELFVYEVLSFNEIAILTGNTVEEVVQFSNSAVEKISPKLKELYGADIVFTLDGEETED